MPSILGVDFDIDHGLEVAKTKDRLSVTKWAAQY